MQARDRQCLQQLISGEMLAPDRTPFGECSAVADSPGLRVSIECRCNSCANDQGQGKHTIYLTVNFTESELDKPSVRSSVYAVLHNISQASYRNNVAVAGKVYHVVQDTCSLRGNCVA